MANYAVLKAAVEQVVKANGNEEITGTNLQSILLSIINSIGTGYQFMGVATPSTEPGTPDQNVFYIAGAGTYANFGASVTVPTGSIGIFSYNGTWHKDSVSIIQRSDWLPDCYTALDNTDNPIVNKMVSYFASNVAITDLSSNNSLQIAHLLSDTKYHNVLYIYAGDTRTTWIDESFDTQQEALDAIMDNPIRVANSNSGIVVFNVHEIEPTNTEYFRFVTKNSIKPKYGDSKLFSKYFLFGGAFDKKLGNSVFKEIYTTDNTLRLSHLVISLFNQYNSSYQIDIQTAYKKQDDSTVYGVAFRKRDFASMTDAIDYYNNTLAGKVIAMQDGRGYMICNPLHNIDGIYLSNVTIYPLVDTRELRYASSIDLYLRNNIGSLYKTDTILRYLVKEIYINSEIDISTINFIRIGFGASLASSIYNVIYVYRTGGLSTISILQHEYNSVADALADFKGVLGNNNRGMLIAVNDAFAASLTMGGFVDLTMDMLNASMLSLNNCPIISEYLNPDSFIIGKSVVWEGDSIAAGNTYGNAAWRLPVQTYYGMSGTNYSVGGSVITSNINGLDSSHWMSTRIDSETDAIADADYFILDGGTNDADRIGRIVHWKSGTNQTIHERIDPASYPSQFGTWNDTDYSGDYDKNTFCGGLEYIIWKVLSLKKGIRIGYIIPPKMGTPAGLTFYNRLEYFREAMAICKKWGVPVINLWEDSWMNPLMPNQYDPSLDVAGNVSAGNYYCDGQHPTPTAYNYLSKLIGEWMVNL